MTKTKFALSTMEPERSINWYIFLLFLMGSVALGLVQGNLLEESGLAVYFIFLSQSLILYIWDSNQPKQSFIFGLAFGFAFFGYSTRWIFEASQHFGVSNSISIVFITLILSALSATTGLAAALTSIVGRYKPNQLLFIVGASTIWFFSEWLRTWIFTGFPYFQVGYGFVNTPLSGYMPIVGSLGTGFVVTALSASLVASCKSKHLLTVFLPVSVGIFLAGWGLQKIDFTEYQKDITVRVINGDVGKQQKQSRFSTDHAIETYRTITRELPRVEMVVWPESSIPEAFMRIYKRDLKQEFQALSSAGTEVILGTYLKEIKDGIKSYNVVISGSDIKQRYYKRHRVPFGEYMPDIFKYFFPPGFLEDIDPVDFEQSAIKTADLVISPSICFELMFPYVMHFEGSNLLVNTSDLSWFETNLVARKMSQIAKARALETGKYLVRSDNYGESIVVSDKGKVVAIAQPGDKYIDATVQLRYGTTWYVLSGNYPLLIIAFATILLLILSANKSPGFFRVFGKLLP